VNLQESVGVIVIGRNEGERLVGCLESVINHVKKVVYVDSNSLDNSVIVARTMGVEVVELDMSTPFTAARARNEGFRRLSEMGDDIQLLQFIDGDCELIDGWFDLALAFMEGNNDAAIVCGRLKERNPDHSVYNRLCDIEWDVPAGTVNSCGGIFMIRAGIFNRLGGFRESLIAGEEPELCLRVRQAGYSIHRIENDMAWHDANMMYFYQWWKRATRSGHAYAEGAWMHGKKSQRHWVREVRRNWFWGLSFPVLLVMAAVWEPMALLLLIYPVQILRIYRHSNVHRCFKDRSVFSFFCVLANLPIMFGQIKFHINRLMGNKSRLIEYK